MRSMTLVIRFPLVLFCQGSFKTMAAHTHTPCGGTLVSGLQGRVRDFDASDDDTGLFSKVFKTKRVALAWIQISPSRRALVCSVYATTGASQEQSLHDQNDLLFADLFTIFAQFGEIPIILAGDFQSLPLSYPSISHAVNSQGWSDPLSTVDDDGTLNRPLTYSRDSLFSGQGEACSSIDAIPLNQTAFCALKSCRVIETFGKQHRPIECTFNWHVLSHVGYVHYKSAPFDLSGIPHELLPSVQQGAEDSPVPVSPEWEESWDAEFNLAVSPDDRWDMVNRFCIQQLLRQGATWGEGYRTRAQPPRFVSKTVCPPQLSNRCAATRHSTILFKLQNRVDELFVRHSRGHKSAQDWFIFRQTSLKVSRALVELKAPLQWPLDSSLSLVHIQAVKCWVTQAIQQYTLDCKRSRINRWKQRLRESSQKGCKYVFQHLKNKMIDEPPNLIVDEQQNIIYQPDQAIQFLNDKWDSVYGTNTLHEHPLKMLETVWPYIAGKIHEASIPPIDAKALFRVIHRRKKNAAPGLDGWRTVELQALPISAFVPIAKFFQWAEDSFGDELPKMLTCTKQIILHKPGLATAMNKRLISILPALILSYTGARYEQLQDWQRTTMPSGIIGGIKGRTMPMLHTALRLEIDEAKSQDQGLVGIKLDKAKCFDRIIPSHASALFLAFGLPKGLVNLFTKLYRGLHRHMCYKGWVSPKPTTAANGVAQGCSLSLIAINVHTKVWFHLLEHFPTITVRAYVDDAYLWCRIQALADLDHAVQLTKLWDSLNGQQLNDAKSSVWGTTTAARKAVQEQFPGMSLTLILDTLGTRIYTSDRQDFGFPDSTLRKACLAADCIGALPLPMKIRSFLVGAKVVPMITYAAHISRIPKLSMQKIQSAICKAIWRGRPMARSKRLVHLFHGQPHRTEPTLAHAFNTIVDIARYCFDCPEAIPKLRLLWHTRHQLKFSLCLTLDNACKVFNLRLNQHMQVFFGDSGPLQLGITPPGDVAASLKQIARQATYELAGSSARKDFVKPGGLLDFHASTLFLRKPTFHTPVFPTSCVHAESAIVGCTLTRDRLYAAGWCSSNQCRFCHAQQETLRHLVYECSEYHQLVSTPVLHELGLNFPLLGIVEHPRRLAQFRLQSEIADHNSAAVFCPLDDMVEIWTDGSVLHQESFWLTTATFAAVDKVGCVIHRGRFMRWHLSSFVAELWAIWVTFSRSTAPVCIYCDNQAVVKSFKQLSRTGHVPHYWKCADWWRAIADLLAERRLQHANPCLLEWIPAHLFEDKEEWQLDPIAVIQKGTTVEHIMRNRQADRAAKQCAAKITPVYVHMPRIMQAAATLHQEWLVRLHVHLDTTTEGDETIEIENNAPAEEYTVAAARHAFPKWPWDSIQFQYNWKPKLPTGLPPPAKWRHHVEDWRAICAFLSSLRWRKVKGEAIAFCELSIAFHEAGFRVRGDYAVITIHSVTCRIRHAVQFLMQDDRTQVCPGIFNARFVKSQGRTLCQSAIVDAAPFLSQNSLFTLARTLRSGAGRSIASWRRPFLDV